MRRTVVVTTLFVSLALGLGACGSDTSTPKAASLTPGESAAAEDFPRPPTDGEISPAVAAACTAEASPTIKSIQDRGTLNWALGISPPFGFKDSDGSYAGVEVDNAEELAHILDVDVKIQDYDYGLLPPAITSGKADIIGAQLFITPERAEVVDFSDPYYVSGQLFYVLADSPWQTIDDLNSPDNRFVFGTGNAQEGVAKDVIPKAPRTAAPLRGQALLYDFLSSKRADSSMTEAQLMKPLQAQFTDPALAAIGMNGRVTSERPTEADLIAPFDVAFGLPKGDAGFKSCIDAWVGDMKESTSIDQRIEYWLKSISG
jgi:polar amino acid transport system substrate-binding protein